METNLKVMQVHFLKSYQCIVTFRRKWRIQLRTIFGTFSKLRSRLLAPWCLSVCRYGTTRLPLDGFSWNLIFENFSKIFWKTKLKFCQNLTGLTGTLHEYLCTSMVIIPPPRYRFGVVQRVGRGIALLFHDRGTRRGWVVSSTSRPQFNPRKDLVPILQEAGWTSGPVWTVGRSRSPPGIDPRTVQPVASSYIEWATGPTMVKCTLIEALRLCPGSRAHRGNRGTALLFLGHGTSRGWGVSVTSRPLFTPGKTRYPFYRRLGGPQVRSGMSEVLVPSGIRSRTVHLW